MKKTVLMAAMLLVAVIANAQTNIQELYDFNRGHFTTTLEMFQTDNWGSTFFFNDIYHPNTMEAPTGYYTEIARALNFWKGSQMDAFSLHVEWNGGQYANNCWLFGVEYFMHSADFNNTFTFELLYKSIAGQAGNTPLQFTFVWGMKDFLNVKGLVFSGFLDIWGENNTWTVKDDNEFWGYRTETTKMVLLTEPQLWYNVGQHFGCENLFVGGEVEIAYNFTGGWKPFANDIARHSAYNANKGLTIAPCLGLKWVF